MSVSSTNGVAGGLLQQGPIAVNLGLAAFADALHAQGARVVHVEWTPPAVDDETAAILDKLL